MSFLRRGDLARARAALFAEPFLAAVLEEAGTQAGGRAARRADVLQVRQLYRHVLFDHAALWVLPAGANVPFCPVYPLDKPFSPLWIHLANAPFLGAIVGLH